MFFYDEALGDLERLALAGRYFALPFDIGLLNLWRCPPCFRMSESFRVRRQQHGVSQKLLHLLKSRVFAKAVLSAPVVSSADHRRISLRARDRHLGIAEIISASGPLRTRL